MSAEDVLANNNSLAPQPIARPRWWMWLSWGGWLALLLGPQLGRVPYPLEAAFSDIVVAHLPQIVYLRRAWSLWHTLPLWAPTYHSGYPFYADPLSGLWYAPGWLAVVLPLPEGITLTVGLHWLLSAWGMYAFLRAIGHTESGAFLASVAWLGFGKVWAHWAGGHLSLLYAVAWTPWLLWVSLRRGRFLRPAVVLALIFLADPRWAAYAGALWALWEWHHSRGRAWRRILSEGLLAALLAAPLALPLWHYTQLSTRAHLTPQDVLLFSLPWSRLLGVVVPIGGLTEWVTYVGAVSVLLVSAAWLRREARFWAGVALLALGWALGEHLPGMTWLARLPGVSLLRVPSRGLFLAGFAIAAAAAAGWDALLSAAWPEPLRKRRNLLWFALVVFGFGATALTGMLLGDPWVAGSSLFWLLVGWAAWKIPPRHPWGLRVWALLLAVDLLAFATHLVAPRPFDALMQPPPVLTEAAASEPTAFRFYSPSYSIPQQIAAAQGWELANGVDPLVLAAYSEFLEKASGFSWKGYTVVVPPLDSDNLAVSRHSVPNPTLLGLLNVAYVVSDFPLSGQAWTLWAHRDGLWVYRNPQWRPRAWVAQGEAWHPARDVRWSPNRITIVAEGPGELVLSEVAYPGWQVTVDGRAAEAHTAHGVLRSVQIPEGVHTVTWRFRPGDLVLGLLAAVVGWLVVIFGPRGVPASAWGGRP